MTTSGNINLTDYVDKYKDIICNLSMKATRSYQKYLNTNNVPREEYYDRLDDWISTTHYTKKSGYVYKTSIRRLIEKIREQEKGGV